MKIRKGIIYFLLFAVIIVLLVYFKVKPPSDKQQQTSKTKIPTLVNAFVVGTQKLDNNLFATGTVMANNEVELRSEINGKITKVLFEEGTHVKKGQLLVKLNDADLQAQREKLKYEEKMVQDMEFRQKKLLEANGISQEEYDATLNKLNTTKADLNLLKAQIDKTEIRAPFDGVVGLKYVYEGSYVSPGIRITSIVDINPVKIDFSIPEKYSNYIHNGDEIHFYIQGTEEQFTGKVYAIEPKVDELTRTLHLRAVCTNKEEKILPGSFAKIMLVLDTYKEAVMIPSQAIISVMNGKRVYIFSRGKAVQKEVETGIRNETQIQILSGVNPGDTVITTGFMQFKPNDKVRIMSYMN